MEFSCHICLSHFDSVGHKPLLLPACGHTFCAFCVQHLCQQGKTSCPKCRKDKAVQPVSSLPVNYSLLEIVQSKLSGAAAEEPPSSPTEETIGRRLQSPGLPDSVPEPSGALRKPNLCDLRKARHRRIMQASLQSSSMRGNPMYTPASNPLLTAVSPSASRYTAVPTPAERTIHPGAKREVQDELDFQMAVHLTFCKDLNHDLNQHTNCPVWRKQNEENEDVNTVISLMQQI